MALRTGMSQIQQAQRRRRRESHEGKAMLQTLRVQAKMRQMEREKEGQRA